jgi:predicted permease
MTSLLLLIVCLASGFLIGRYGRPPAGLAGGVGWFAMNVALPAFTLHYVAQLHVDLRMWILVASQWIVFLGAWVFVALVGRRLGWTRSRIGCVVLLAGLGNTAFMGYPLIEMLRGVDALPLAIVADQAGSFVVLPTLGVLVAALYAGRSVTPSAMVRRVLTYPPFLAFVGALLVGALLGRWATVDTAWALLDSVLARLGAMLSPLAIFSIALSLKLRASRDELVAVAVGIGWKMVLAPLVVLAVGLLARTCGASLDIAVLQSAMAPMISAALLAQQEDLEPPLATAIVGIGIVLSLATVPLVAHWLSGATALHCAP